MSYQTTRMRVWKDGGPGGGKDDARWQRDGLTWMCGSRAIGIFPFLADKNGSSGSERLMSGFESYL